MKRDVNLRERRDADIRKDYDRLRAERKGRAPKYTVEYVIHWLSQRYYLSVVTIERVVYAKS